MKALLPQLSRWSARSANALLWWSCVATSGACTPAVPGHGPTPDLVSSRDATVQVRAPEVVQPHDPPLQTAQPASAAPVSNDVVLRDDDLRVGREVRVPLFRGETWASHFFAHSCPDDAHVSMDLASLRWDVTFATKQKNLVRAFPVRITDACPLARVRVTRRESFGQTVTAVLLDAPTLTPREPTAAKTTADYLTLDDVALAGSSAWGTILETAVYRESSGSTIVNVCGAGAGMQSIHVDVPTRAHDVWRALSSDPREGCSVVRMRMVSRAAESGLWNATLLAPGESGKKR